MDLTSSSSPKAPQRWTLEEDAQLSIAVLQEEQAGRTTNWQKVANLLPGRTNKDCRKRWHYQISRPFQRGPWSEDEDMRLRQAVRQYGTRWSKVADFVRTRNGDQCYKRWNDSLDPQINKSPWTEEEDYLLLQGVQTMGRNWKDIVNSKLPYRTGLAAKNRYSVLQRQMEHSGTMTPGDLHGRVTGLESSSASSNLTDDINHSVLDDILLPNVSAESFNGGDVIAGGTGHRWAMSGLEMLPPGLNEKHASRSEQPDGYNCYNHSTAGFGAVPHSDGQSTTLPDVPHWQTSGNGSYQFSSAPIVALGQSSNASSLPSSSRRHSPVGPPTGDVIVRASCQEGQTEYVLAELTKVVNSMALRGDIRSFNCSIEQGGL